MNAIKKTILIFVVFLAYIQPSIAACPTSISGIYSGSVVGFNFTSIRTDGTGTFTSGNSSLIRVVFDGKGTSIIKGNVSPFTLINAETGQTSTNGGAALAPVANVLNSTYLFDKTTCFGKFYLREAGAAIDTEFTFTVTDSGSQISVIQTSEITGTFNSAGSIILRKQ